MHGYPNLMVRFTTLEEVTAQSLSLTIRASGSVTRSVPILLPCGRHLVIAQCRQRPTQQWYARVPSLHSGECTAPLVVPLEEA